MLKDKKRILVLLGLVAYSLLIVLAIYILLYYLFNSKPIVNNPILDNNQNNTALTTVLPSANPNIKPAACDPNCTLSDVNKVVTDLRKQTQYTENITLGFDCLSEYQRDYYGLDYEEVLKSSTCNPDQVGINVRVVKGIRYVKSQSEAWQKKTEKDVDYYSLPAVLPKGNLSDKVTSYKDDQGATMYYQDFFNQGFDLKNFGFGIPDYKYYVFRKEGKDQRCLTDKYDPFIQGSPTKTGDLDPSSCGNYVWFFDKGLNFLEYRTVGFEFKAIFVFSNWGNTKKVEAPV